jgi:hypothetical protein
MAAYKEKREVVGEIESNRVYVFRPTGKQFQPPSEKTKPSEFNGDV